MTNDTEVHVREGLRQALIQAVGNLYRVYTSPDAVGTEREAAFMRGVEKHTEAYERMNQLIGGPKPPNLPMI